MNNLKRAIDADLSRLRVTQRERAEILKNAMEGKKVKKKLSVSLVLVVALVLAVAAALAYTVSQHYFEDVARLESQYGYYDDWKLSQKIEMLEIMKQYGILSDEQQTAALTDGDMSDAEREAKIDAFMVERYGINGRTDIITLARILDVELGDRDTWTQEQNVWYTQMLIDSGLMGADEDVYRMPDESAVPPEEAIAVATAEIMRVWALTEDDLSRYSVEWAYYTHVSDKEESWLHYDITFRPTDGEGNWLSCPVSKEGRVLSSADHEWFSSPEEQRAAFAEMENSVDREARELFQQYAADHGFNKPVGEASVMFWDWPLTDKKALADLVRPVVLRNMAENPDYADWSFAFYATHEYGVPDESAITQETALETARRALGERLELSDALLGYCDSVRVFYEVTDPEKPLWKFVFSAGSHWDEVEALGAEPAGLYRVVINARTGDVEEAFSFRNGDGVTGLEAVERQQ